RRVRVMRPLHDLRVVVALDRQRGELRTGKLELLLDEVGGDAADHRVAVGQEAAQEGLALRRVDLADAADGGDARVVLRVPARALFRSDQHADAILRRLRLTIFFITIAAD